MPLNKQQVFDKVALHLLKQNARSLAKEASGGAAQGDCAYRGENGLMCAVGCLIPDDLYDPETEGTTASNIIACDVRLQVLFEPEVASYFFLDKLQNIHDVEPVQDWYFHLRDFAIKHSLSIDVLTNP